MNLHRIVGQRAPAVIPPGWRHFDIYSGPAIVRDYSDGLRALFSIDTLDDGKEWRHLSMSRQERYPGWDEMVVVIRECGLTDDKRDVVMVLPPKREHVNVMPNCFHWWQEVLS